MTNETKAATNETATTGDEAHRSLADRRADAATMSKCLDDVLVELNGALEHFDGDVAGKAHEHLQAAVALIESHRYG